MSDRFVIALGGNALGKDIEEQRVAVATTARILVDLVEQGHELVITHGNGPQIGMIQRAMDDLTADSKDYKPIPLPTCVAMSQGYIGIDLQNAIKDELQKRNIDKKVTTILSQVEVDPEDKAFQRPNKPIGNFMTKEEADELEKKGITCMKDANRGYRIAVASPMPKRIRELETVKTLLDAGHVVITCGGGGIPVVEKDGELVGVSAVVDKDNVSSFLATALDAEELVILTAVEYVALNFGTDHQIDLPEMTVAEAKKYAAEGHFAEGSMLPKVEAAVRFAESGKEHKSLITLLQKGLEGIEGKTGTLIHQ